MLKNFDLSNFIIVIARKWKFVFFNWILIGVIAVVYSFFVVEKQFVSSISFLPPFEEQSLFSLIPGGSFGSFTSTDIIPQQIITIYQTKLLRRKVIEQFNLYEKYKLTDSKNKFERALKKLKNDMVIDVEEIGSLGITKHVSYTISCYHTSPESSYAMAQYSFYVLDSIIREISIDRGRRSKIFVQNQLALNRQTLDSLQSEFEQFQKEEKIYNVSAQVQLVLNNYGQVKGQLLANEIKINNLKNDYNNRYPLIVALKKENKVFQSTLSQMEKTTEPDVLIGLDKSAEMMPKYTDFLRDMEVQNKLILLLTQQLEEAKLKESRDFSPLKIIDVPFVPEYKIRPKRIFLTIGIIGVYLMFLFMIIYFQQLFNTTIRETVLFNEIVSIFKKGK